MAEFYLLGDIEFEYFSLREVPGSRPLSDTHLYHARNLTRNEEKPLFIPALVTFLRDYPDLPFWKGLAIVGMTKTLTVKTVDYYSTTEWEIQLIAKADILRIIEDQS